MPKITRRVMMRVLTATAASAVVRVFLCPYVHALACAGSKKEPDEMLIFAGTALTKVRVDITRYTLVRSTTADTMSWPSWDGDTFPQCGCARTRRAKFV